jgi:hypothetical protein
MAQSTLALPRMEELRPANNAIGNRNLLNQIMADRGYWFFRGVLDDVVIAEMRDIFIDVLVKMGVVDPGSRLPVWNGASLDAFPDKIETLHGRRLWQDFVRRPTIKAFFEELFGEAVFWVPSVEYRITPPRPDRAADPVAGRHQDGFANYGIGFLTCWIPLVDIDEATGGLAMAEGLHKGPILHDLNDVPRHRIPAGVIPSDVWRRSDYHPGDLVMFCPEIPHSGLPNVSNMFRLSMDIRVMPASGHVPVVGNLAAITTEHVTIANHDGRSVTLVLDENTYCRGNTGARIPLLEMVARLKTGDAMMASEKNGRALLLRPQR